MSELQQTHPVGVNPYQEHVPFAEREAVQFDYDAARPMLQYLRDKSQTVEIGLRLLDPEYQAGSVHFSSEVGPSVQAKDARDRQGVWVMRQTGHPPIQLSSDQYAGSPIQARELIDTPEGSDVRRMPSFEREQEAARLLRLAAEEFARQEAAALQPTSKTRHGMLGWLAFLGRQQ